MSTDSRISPSIRADYLFMIEQAVKAPSGHNTQPWKFRIHSDHIDILPDFSRALPVVDPDHRELFVSLGCAAENLCIAAAHKGWLGKVSTSSDGIIHVGLSRQEDIEAPHFEQIARRQTNRRCYDGSMISENALALLKKTPVEPGIGIHLFQKGTQAFDDIAALVYEGNRRQMGNPAFKAELRQWVRYNRKHQDETADGLSYAVFGAPNLPRFMAEFIISHSLDAEKQNKTDRRNIASASHFALFTTRDNRREHWVGRLAEHCSASCWPPPRQTSLTPMPTSPTRPPSWQSAWRKRWTSPGSIRPSSSAWGTPRHRHTPCAGPLRG